MQARRLVDVEQNLVRGVYAATVPIERVLITDLDLGAPVTLAGLNVRTRRFHYTINWPAGFGGIMTSANRRATLIHEFCHVWQGENGVWPTFYMGQSVWAQLKHGLKDIWETEEWRGWDNHRGTAYHVDPAAIGKNWSSFNVEQQASIVESWFVKPGEEAHDYGPGITGGAASAADARFPYIRDVIRARSRNAPYKAPDPAGAAAAGRPAGFDPQIKAVQDKLVALGYLDARQADGVVGRRRSATLDAVQAFQRANGLEPDRILGGPNSLTRRKLAQPLNTLQRAR